MDDKAIRILLIEDNPGDARLIREMLIEAGGARFQLGCVDRLSAGLEHLAQERVDVLLLDLGLPDSQGLDTLARAQAQVPELPIVVLTGLDDEALATRAVQQGAQDYLVKGQVESSPLARAVHYAIEGKQAEAQRDAALEKLKEYSERLEEMVEERTQDLRDAQEELVRREKLAVLGQLAGAVGHELRNPLGVISNAVYYLEMIHLDADDITKEYLHMISSEVHNADRIISDLLDYARIRPSEREEIAVSALVDRALEKQPAPAGVEVTTSIAADLPHAYVDPGQIGQVLVNLVTNAYHAMPDGGNLTINARRGDPRGRPARGRPEVSISITDTGCGISAENMEKVFEPLFTTKARGIGLGLAVSRNLAQANGGTIEVESTEGEGSTFTVILPTDKRE